MDSSTDDFRKLRQLLKLKRYEQPPPRFFAEFSSQVLERVRAGQAPAEPGWSVTRWLLEFAGCPVPAFACATIACAVVLYGVAFSLGPKPAGDGLAQDPSGGMAQAHDDHTLAPPPGVYLEASMADSSNPVFQTESSVLPVMRVNYVPPR